MLPQAFPKPISPPAGPSKATLPLNITGQTLGPSAFKGLQACRLPAHGHGLHHVQACSSKLAPRRPIQGNSSATHQRPNTMLPQAFPKPISPPASPSKATLPLNITGQTLGPSAFKGLQACRLPAHGHGLHHVQACSSKLAPRRPIQGNSSATHQRPNTRAMCF